jgi:hypothetical protein
VSAVAAGVVRTALEARNDRGLRGRLRRRRRPGFARAVLENGARTYRATASANVAANVIRNVWAHGIIFCGHFPDQTYTFTQEEVANESRGAWYVRQLVGAANIEGSPLFHVASGNLGYQVEHHLFPDMPSTRYAEIAPRVKAICAEYELPYNSGPLSRQWWMVHRTILRLAFPGGNPRPKPGPFKPSDPDELRRVDTDGRHRATGPDGSGPEQRDEGVRVEVPDREER